MLKPTGNRKQIKEDLIFVLWTIAGLKIKQRSANQVILCLKTRRKQKKGLQVLTPEVYYLI